MMPGRRDAQCALGRGLAANVDDVYVVSAGTFISTNDHVPPVIRRISRLYRQAYAIPQS